MNHPVRSHFLGKDTPIELRPLFDGDMHALDIGEARRTADRAGLEKLAGTVIAYLAALPNERPIATE